MQRNAAHARRLFTTIGVVLTMGGMVSGFLSGRDLWWASRSAHWPSVPGEVIESRAGTSGRGRHRGAWKEFAYRYEVAGRQYEGSQVTVGDVMDRDAILETPQSYPEGDTVTVRYDPDFPSRAVLEPGVCSAHWVGLLLPLLLVGIGSTFVLGGRYGRLR